MYDNGSIVCYDTVNATPDDFYPILRPLSDLTKKITHDGMKIVVAKEMWDCDEKEEKAFDVYGTIPEFWKMCLAQSYWDWDYADLRMCLKFHFDVFGFIKKKLAVDINTLNK